ncbi:hypothetical protein AB6C48_04930 [Vibrio splendidus]
MLSKHMFHFALVHEQFAESGDLIKGLLPLFTPLLADKIGQEFSAEKFAKNVNQTYGLDMHPYVAEDLAPKLAEQGVLRVLKNEKKEAKYYIDNVPKIDNEKLQKDVYSIFNKFEKVCLNFMKKSNLESSNINFPNEFALRLAQLDNFIDNYDPKNINKITSKNIIDYAFVRFVNKIEEEGGEIKRALNKAYSGSILSEVILSIKEPSLANNSIEGKNFYIDAPILLNILGFDEPYSVKCSRDLISKIQDLGGIVTTTQNYINEAQASIRYSLENKKYSRSGTGSLNRYLFKNPNELINVRTAQNKVKEILTEKFNFETKKPLVDIEGRLVSQRAQSLRDKLSNELSWYKNETAKDNDTESVTFVVADHDYCSIKNISDSRSFLITPNESLIKSSNNVLYALKAFTKPDMTPLLSEKKLATLLWVISGGTGEDISSLSLVSSCAKAMEMHQDVFYKIQDFIKNVPEDRVKEYESIICDERALNCLIDEVGADYKVINDDNFEDILLRSRETYLESEKLKNEKINKHKLSLEKEISKLKKDREKALRVVISKSNIEIEKDKEKRVLESKIRELTEAVNSLQKPKPEIVNFFESNGNENVIFSDNENLKDSSNVDIESINNLSKKICMCFTVLVSIGLAFSVYSLSGLVINGPIETDYMIIKAEFVEIIKIFISFLPFLATWKLPDFLFNKLISKSSDKISRLLLS